MNYTPKPDRLMTTGNNDEKWWYYARDQQVFGPLPGSGIQQLIKVGNLDRSFFVLRKGTEEWQSIDSVFEFNSLAIPPNTKAAPAPPAVPRASFVGTLSSHVTKAAGLENLESLKGRGLLSQIFQHHTVEEVDAEFSVGSLETTPDLSLIQPEWPKPWIFFRCIVISLAAYFILIQTGHAFENEKLVPSILITGSFAIPLSTLLLFFEFNIRRNVSLFRVMLLFLVGGFASLVIAHPVSYFVSLFEFDFLGASVAAIAEEPAKLLAVYFFARGARFHYIHNGLLFGAAVGTGFAAFESAGYALDALLGVIDRGVTPVANMISTINLRGVLSPFAHIVWTAIAAGALWKAKGSEPLKLSHFLEFSFLRVFAIAVLLHALWNAPFEIPIPFVPFPKFIIIGIVGWVITLSLVQSGIKQIAHEKATNTR